MHADYSAYGEQCEESGGTEHAAICRMAKLGLHVARTRLCIPDTF